MNGEKYTSKRKKNAGALKHANNSRKIVVAERERLAKEEEQHCAEEIKQARIEIFKSLSEAEQKDILDKIEQALLINNGF